MLDNKALRMCSKCVGHHYSVFLHCRTMGLGAHRIRKKEMLTEGLGIKRCTVKGRKTKARDKVRGWSEVGKKNGI